MNGLFVRALIAFLLLPGMVAFVIPALVIAPRDARPFNPAGLLLLLPGVVVLLWCVREFYSAGRGTLAPWSPPTSLVVSGPYRFSRNPMYVGVLTILCGWALAYRSIVLAIYAVIVAVAFHLRVVYYEEPWLGRTHAGTWPAYRARVRRWV